MGLSDLKKRILENPFADRVRVEMVFDEEAYTALVGDLSSLAHELRGEASVDRELMLELYTLPLVVRNSFLAGGGSSAGIFGRLEDAWVELDDLVTRCLLDVE